MCASLLVCSRGCRAVCFSNCTADFSAALHSYIVYTQILIRGRLLKQAWWLSGFTTVGFCYIVELSVDFGKQEIELNACFEIETGRFLNGLYSIADFGSVFEHIVASNEIYDISNCLQYSLWVLQWFDNIGVFRL